MKRIILIAIGLTISFFAHAAWGFFDAERSYVGFNVNGTSESFSLWNSGTGTFHNNDFGTILQGQAFQLTFFDVKTYKNDGSDVTGCEYFYTIYEYGNRPSSPTFTSLGGGFLSDLGGGDQKWGVENLSVDLLSGLDGGDYVLEIFGSVVGTNPDVTIYDNNNGNVSNYNARFTYIDITSSSEDGNWNAIAWTNGIPDDYSNTSVNNNVTIDSYNAKSNNLTINTDANLIVSSSSTLTVNGNLNVSVSKNEKAAGTLTLESSSSGTGSLLIDGSVSGNINAERYVEAYSTGIDGWHHISSPVATFAIAGSDFVPGANDDFFSWSEADAYWYNYQQSEGPDYMNEGEGYLVAYETTATKTFIGTVNNADKTFNDLSYTTNDYQGWHLLGNPFPCALKWDATSWNRTNIDAVAKIWNESNASYDDLNQNGIIPAMNGFMVHVNNSTNSITIPTDDRTHSATGWLKDGEINTLKLTVFDLEGNTAQQSVLKFNQDATEAYDGEFDSYFLSGYAPQFYSMIDEKAVSTNTLPELYEELEVPFYFIKNGSSTYRLEIEGIESLETSSPVYLTDNKTGQTINVSEVGTYNFQAEEGDDPARFMLHFKSTGIDDLPSIPAPSVHVSGNQLNVQGSADEINAIRIIDITGRILFQKSGLHNQEISLPLRLETGIYIVEVETEAGKFANKVYIK